MIKAIENLYKKIKLNEIGEQTEWKRGYAYGLKEAIRIVEDGIDDLVIPGNNYFVVMFENGNRYLPYIEEMRLYKITTSKSRKSYCFSRNLNATKFNTPIPDVVLSSAKSLRKRVFFTFEDADKAINKDSNSGYIFE